jgi:hypothetical protein
MVENLKTEKSESKEPKLVPNKIDIEKCPRCFGEHSGLLFTKFKHPDPPKDTYPPYQQEYIGWAICPNTQEPLFIPQQDHVWIPVPANVERVRDLAHSLWKAGGKRDGHAEIHWRMAEFLLREWWVIPSAKGMRDAFEEEYQKGIFDLFQEEMVKHYDRTIVSEILAGMNLTPRQVNEEVVTFKRGE